MKTLLDPQIFNDQVYGGISRYYTEVFSRLSRNKDVVVLNPVLITKNEYFLKSLLFGKEQKKYDLMLKIASFFKISVRKKTRNINVNRVKKLLSNKDFDVFIPTYYNPYFLEYIGNKPFVLTVYDMIYELFPQYFIDDTTLVINKKILIEKATKIIAVSNNTKKDIIKFYPNIDESKIEVIYHGNSINSTKICSIKIPNKYILFVGDRKFYKNFSFFIASLKDVLQNDKNLYVLCAGGGSFNDEEVRLLHDLKIKDQVLQKKFADDNELAHLYKNAICFVFPSEYEGFGIPVLEAMACGCPIVLTNNSSFPEVAGEAGMFFELNNADDLKRKVESFIENEGLRNEYSKKGLEQVKKFNWDEAANECLKVYKDAITTT